MSYANLKKWDRESYYRLSDIGAFRPEERVELIEGLIFVKSPQNKPNRSLIGRAAREMSGRFTHSHIVRVQCPLDLGNSQPEPDIAVVTLGEDEQCRLHPRSADLLMEVAECSETYDRFTKASLYAKYGFPELWIALIGNRNVEVCRDPRPDASAPHGFSYTSRIQVTEGTPIFPLFAPTEAFELFSPKA